MRRKYITHPDYQKPFAFWFLVGTLAIPVILGIINWLTLYVVTNNITLDAADRQMVAFETNNFLFVTLYVVIITVLIGSFLGVFLSYKSVGPLRRVESWMEAYLHGYMTAPLRLRPGDEMNNLVTSMSNIVKRRLRIQKKDL